MINKYSKHVTQDPNQPAAQAMLHAIGLTKADLLKPQIGIASTGWDGNPCNMHLNDLAKDIKTGVNAQDLVGLIFNTIGVSDGISMGTAGMRFSLPSRDIIADSIETVVSAQWYDGVIAVVGCDKNMPGALMALGRLNRPGIIVYGGTIAPGCHAGKNLDVVSAFEALGQKLSGEIDQVTFENVILQACPGAGACGGMYTANTMASAIEGLGMSLPYNSSNPAISKNKSDECAGLGAAIRNLLEMDLKPRDIVTLKSLENAVRLITILGGSTNAVLHLLAVAHDYDLPFSLDDFQRWSDDTPFLADLKPSGKYVMQDLHDVGGIPAVMKMMLNEGLLDGSCMSVTGYTIADNLKNIQAIGAEQKVIYPVSQPVKPTGHIQILFGNLASEGSVAKITGKEGEKFVGPAKVYNSEEEANTGIQNKEIREGNVIVIRYCGPKGGPGMPEMLKPTSLIMGAGLGKGVALITDGRFSGGTHGFVVGHITPEAYDGGNIALIEDGDIITIDAVNNNLSCDVSDEIWAQRKSKWSKPGTPLKGFLKKYRATVASASQGCITC
ncbi:MAG: dihydroxy-acid dehydratase [Saprospiraceae bacterium]|nr:dihydroxy-acid dehydratase [Saprospiraceae bacterium]